MEAKEIKVKFRFGNNNELNYYIIDRKKNAIDMQLNPDTLAFKINDPGLVKVSKYASGIPFGNYDYLLEIRKKKDDEFIGIRLAHKEDITIENK